MHLTVKPSHLFKVYYYLIFCIKHYIQLWMWRSCMQIPICGRILYDCTIVFIFSLFCWSSCVLITWKLNYTNKPTNDFQRHEHAKRLSSHAPKEWKTEQLTDSPTHWRNRRKTKGTMNIIEKKIRFVNITGERK